jgi:hypothetical protein
LLESWNRRPRDTELVREIMDTVFAAFRGYSENSGLLVTTTKLDFEAFRQRVDLETVVRLAGIGQVPSRPPCA